MSYVVTRHRCNTEDGDGTGAFDIYCLFITRSEAAVKVARITTVRRYLLHRDRHFLLRISEVGHVCQEHEYSLSCKSELLGNCQSHIRHQCALYDRVRSSVNEHYRMAHGSALLEGITEFHVVIVFESHASQDDDVYFSLHRDSREQLVVRFSGNGEDRELLALNQCVEYVDHRNSGTYHLVRKDTLCRVE